MEDVKWEMEDGIWKRDGRWEMKEDGWSIGIMEQNKC